MMNKLADTITQIRLLVLQDDLENRLSKAAHIIGDAFGYYFVGFYFIDESKRTAVFQAGSSEVGRVLKKNSYTLPLSRKSRLPYIALNEICLYDWQEETRFYCLLPNVISPDFVVVFTESPYSLHSPLLPKTRWQLFLPLRHQKQLFGVLEIQREDGDWGFTREEISSLQQFADQIAPFIKP